MNTLNGVALVNEGIITGPIADENVQQHGVDLNLIKVEAMLGSGIIPKDGKTQLVAYEEMPLLFTYGKESESKKTDYWLLKPGTYSVTFEQGCKIPFDKMLLIRQRSSLLRNGTILHSSVFDAGFETDNIGTVICVTVPIQIEYGARIAQIYGHHCTEVTNLYDGQFQKDKQRQD